MDDDEVAAMMAKEARESFERSSAEGTRAYVPRSGPARHAPKINARFFRNLVRDTDSHNASLRRKQEKEAEDHKRRLQEQSQRAPERTRQDPRSDRDSRRRDRKIPSEDKSGGYRDSRGNKNRNERRPPRSDTMNDDVGDRKEQESEHSRHRSSRGDRPRHRNRSSSRSRSRSPYSSRKSRSYRSERHERRRSSSPSGRRSHKSSRASRLSAAEGPDSRDRRSSHAEHRRRDSSSNESDTAARSAHQSRPVPTKSTATEPRSLPIIKRRKYHSSDESDPLDDLIGPLPPKAGEEPVRSRGRGIYNANPSTIDSHFAPDYDPALDVEQPRRSIPDRPSARRQSMGVYSESESSLSPEVSRDRAYWTQRGEARLRAAGFDEALINRVTKPPKATVSDEPDLEGLRWSRKGEGREWDRGKFTDDQGHTDVRPQW
ncbi:hypothetical protein N7470_005148 [Penicillium chermesinum]|nr:hypothetical protein N7470_005148 [Penicillium chermesinum]